MLHSNDSDVPRDDGSNREDILLPIGHPRNDFSRSMASGRRDAERDRGGTLREESPASSAETVIGVA
jgi:hypothetical protein